MTKGKQLL